MVFFNCKKINGVIKEVKSKDGNYMDMVRHQSTLACKIIDIKSNNIVEILEDNIIKVGKYSYSWHSYCFQIYSVSEKDLIICFAWNFIEDDFRKIEINMEKIKIISTKDGKVYET